MTQQALLFFVIICYHIPVSDTYVKFPKKGGDGMGPSSRIRCIRYIQKTQNEPELCSRLGVNVCFEKCVASEGEDGCVRQPTPNLWECPANPKTKTIF